MLLCVGGDSIHSATWLDANVAENVIGPTSPGFWICGRCEELTSYARQNHSARAHRATNSPSDLIVGRMTLGIQELFETCDARVSKSRPKKINYCTSTLISRPSRPDGTHGTQWAAKLKRLPSNTRKFSLLRTHSRSSIKSERKHAMADTTDSQLIATLGGLDQQWTGMSPARIRSLLREHGFIVSEKRAKALRTGALCSPVEAETENAGSQLSRTSRDTCASCGAVAACHCSRCTRVKYCSKECQRAHWKTHRPSCRPRNTPSAASTSTAPTCPVCDSEWADCQCKEADKPSCWICLESNGTLLRGCACRGSAGYVRMGCLRMLCYVLTHT